MAEFQDVHLTPELLEALARYELPPVVFANLVLNHLVALCPKCRTAVQTTYQRASGDDDRFARAFAAAERAVDEGRRDKSQELRQARRDLTELLRAAPEARGARVRRAIARFRSPLLVDLLIEESRGVVRDKPQEALRLALLASQVAERITAEPEASEKCVRAFAHLANAFRVCGDFAGAEGRFGEARRVLRRGMVIDPLIHAEVARLEGSLRVDQRRFQEAEASLSQAILLYRLTRETKNVAITLMKMAHLHYLRGETSGAIEANLEALRTLDREQDSQLLNWARHNLATYLCENQDFIRARQVLSQVPAEKEGRTTTARRLWLEGRIARGLEELETAERQFKKAVESFRRLRIPLDIALCMLDLAELYLSEGRTSDVVALAGDLDLLFSMPELQAEASQALLLFQNAALQQLLSVQILKEVRSRLERLRMSQSRAGGIC